VSQAQAKPGERAIAEEFIESVAIVPTRFRSIRNKLDAGSQFEAAALACCRRCWLAADWRQP
jgi:hypothetical protein